MLERLKMAARAAAVVTLSLTAYGPQALAEEKVVVATPGAALHFYPFYVAEAAGLFKEDGITIEWVDVGAGSRQIAAVASRSADFAVVGMQPSISARENGADLVAVGSLFNAYPIQLVLSNGGMDKTGITPQMAIDDVVSRLKNVTIAVTGIGSTTDVLLRSWLAKRGVDPDTAITIQPLGNPAAMFAALEQGSIDGIMLGAPWPEKAEATGVGQIVVDPLKGGIPELEGVPYTGIIASAGLVKEKPEVVGAVVHALAEAMKLTAEQPEKVAAMLKSYFPDTEEAIYAAFEPGYRAQAAKTPVISKEEYQKLVDWIAITSDKPVSVTFEQFIDNQFADKAAAEVLK